jgi:hypothetical protein
MYFNFKIKLQNLEFELNGIKDNKEKERLKLKSEKYSENVSKEEKKFLILKKEKNLLGDNFDNNENDLEENMYIKKMENNTEISKKGIKKGKFY